MNDLAELPESPAPEGRRWSEVAQVAVTAAVALLGAMLVYVIFAPALVVFGLVLIAAGRVKRATVAGRLLTAVGAVWLALGMVALAQLSVHLTGSTSHPVRVAPPVTP